MAILTSVGGGGEASFYDVPDADLQKYAVQKEQLTEDNAPPSLKGKSPSKDDAEGTMPSGMMGGNSDVQGYSSDVCWVRYGRTVYWWYC